VSHFIAFTIFAYIWPQYWLHLFLLGVWWECVEGFLGYCITSKGKNVKRKNIKNNVVQYEQWWSSSSKDILFNGTGIVFGLVLNRVIKNV